MSQNDLILKGFVWEKCSVEWQKPSDYGKLFDIEKLIRKLDK